MIDTANLVNTALIRAKQGTSGYFSEEQMNNNIASIEKDIIKIYSSMFEATRIISNDINHLITTVQLDAMGTLPDDYINSTFIQNISASKKAVYPILHHQVNSILDNPVRNPSKSGQSYYYFRDKKVNVLKPKSSDKIELTYIKRPEPGKVKYTYNEDDGDYVTITTDVPMNWSESSFNLFLYKLLETMGIESKDQLQLEYSRIGYNAEILKLNNISE